jgi:hypothetical protein
MKFEPPPSATYAPIDRPTSLAYTHSAAREDRSGAVRLRAPRRSQDADARHVWPPRSRPGPLLPRTGTQATDTTRHAGKQPRPWPGATTALTEHAAPPFSIPLSPAPIGVPCQCVYGFHLSHLPMAHTSTWNDDWEAVRGDADGVTYYTDRHHRTIQYPAAPPRLPPTPIVAYQREVWRRATSAWRALSITDRSHLCQACRLLRLQLTGPSLWQYLCSLPDQTYIDTLERHLPWPLPPRPPKP